MELKCTCPECGKPIKVNVRAWLKRKFIKHGIETTLRLEEIKK